jgi:ABC-type nitrate/sulfonate/bicarbonate transport system substrate-binding protein
MTLQPSGKCLVVDNRSPWPASSCGGPAGAPASRAQGGALRWLLRSVLIPLAALAPIGVSGATMAADAIEQSNLELAAVRDPQLGAQVAIANHYGYFKEEGLNVTVRWTQSGADIMTFMASGQQNLAAGSTLGQVLMGAQDLPVKTIAALADNAATQGLMLSPGVKLGSPRELEGRKLAQTQGTPPILILSKMASLYDFDMRKITLVNMNASEGVVAASKGDVDGLLSWEPNLNRLHSMGGTLYANGTTVFVTGSPQPQRLLYNNALLMASQDWIDSKPNTLKAVLRAIIKADRLLATDRPKALAALQEELRIDPEPIKVMTENNIYGLALTDAVALGMSEMSAWALENKRIPKTVNPEALIAPKLLAEIDPQLVRLEAKH